MSLQAARDRIDANWENILTDSAIDGSYAVTFDASKNIGEGYYNEPDVFEKEFNQPIPAGTPAKIAGPVEIRHIQIVIRLIPGNPPSYYVHTCYPIVVATYFGKSK